MTIRPLNMNETALAVPCSGTRKRQTVARMLWLESDKVRYGKRCLSMLEAYCQESKYSLRTSRKEPIKELHPY